VSFLRKKSYYIVSRDILRVLVKREIYYDVTLTKPTAAVEARGARAFPRLLLHFPVAYEKSEAQRAIEYQSVKSLERNQR